MARSGHAAGMKQRIVVPSAPLIGQTIGLPPRFGDHGIIGNVDPFVVNADTGRSWIPNPVLKWRNHRHPNSMAPCQTSGRQTMP